MHKEAVPVFDDFMNPILKALKALGGSGSNEEIYSKTVELMELTDEQLEVLHNADKGTRTEAEYRIAWAKTYLKKHGLLENSSKAVWALTAQGQITDNINPKDVKKSYGQPTSNISIADAKVETEAEYNPRDEVISQLLSMSPDAFERLTQRILRESGFIQVEVTGQSGDGGIDGKGIMRIGGLLSFHVLFQCKRYKGSVPPKEIRDFRGAMVGRADKGIFITTGNFTKDALKEASRDGAPPIDLIDGDLLIDILQTLKLGMKTETYTRIVVDKEWFKTI